MFLLLGTTRIRASVREDNAAPLIGPAAHIAVSNPSFLSALSGCSAVNHFGTRIAPYRIVELSMVYPESSTFSFTHATLRFHGSPNYCAGVRQMATGSLIPHVDADAFCASVEQALDPTLRERAVTVGFEGRRVVSAPSTSTRSVFRLIPMRV